jgi:hypothetical protein
MVRLAQKRQQKHGTYNRRDSQMVTHSSTSRPVQCLCMAERTGCPVFTDLWSYVPDLLLSYLERKDGYPVTTSELLAEGSFTKALQPINLQQG